MYFKYGHFYLIIVLFCKHWKLKSDAFAHAHLPFCAIYSMNEALFARISFILFYFFGIKKLVVSFGSVSIWTYCDVNVANLHKFSKKLHRIGSLSTQCARAAAATLLSATRTIWPEWSSDFLFPCMKTNSRGAPVKLPQQSQSALSHNCVLSSWLDWANKTWACFAATIKAIALVYHREVVGQDFHPFSGISQGSQEVSQMCTCFLLSSLLIDGESFTTAAVTFQYRWWVQPRARSTCYCNLKATVKWLMTGDFLFVLRMPFGRTLLDHGYSVNSLSNEISCWAYFFHIISGSLF